MAIVFLIDDDASVRKALSRLVRSAGYDVQAFASAQDFLDSQPNNIGPACLVLDVQMPGLDGLELQQTLHTSAHYFPVLFVTGHGDIPMSVKAMRNGAVDFLQKPVDGSELLRAIGQALARAAEEDAALAELKDMRQRLDQLSPREREVMERVVAGMLNKQIAYELGTVEKTIKVHRARVMDK